MYCVVSLQYTNIAFVLINEGVIMFYSTAVMVAGFLRVQCVYHELSKLEFKAPATVQEDALFGYSIAYQPTVKHLVISAPHGNSVGQVFECNIETQNCTKIIVENIETESAALTDMWLGATVAAGNNFTVMCAPKFTMIHDPNIKYGKRGTFGRCYMSPASGGNVTAMMSLRMRDKGKFDLYELNFDSFGWSSHVDIHDSILIGGPAMHTGRAILYPNVMSAPKLLSYTGNRHINYNFGYSVTSGLFISTNENDIYYAISSPYGTFGAGQIIITNVKESITLDNPLDGKRLYDYKLPVGSLFGASMCSAKLRGPGQRETLLVGAPLFVQGVQVDVGAVFVYQFDPSKKKVVHQQTILGTSNGGQFGSAVISIGDLNGDKKHEVAVSAPYENFGRGVVYIYSAAEILRDVSPNMIRWMQRIQPEGYSTFGLSLTALQNYGDNGCNELAIGAPVSNIVLLYKCLAQIVIHVRPFKEYEKPGYRGARRNSTLFEYNSCVEFVYPEKPTPVEANIKVKVTLQHQNATILNADKDGSMTYNISTLENKNIFCEVVSIEIHEKGGQEPEIQYQVTASQVDGPMDKESYSGRRVILSDLSTLTLTDKLWVADCIGGEHTCVPILTFSVHKSMTDGYVIGSSPTESLSVSVRNVGDPAYTACVRVRVENVRVRRWSPNCVRESATTAECTPKQPIKNNTDWNTGTIELETESLRSDVQTVTFTADLFERCKARPPSVMRSHTKTVHLATNPAELFLLGYSILGDTVYLTNTDIEETGKCIIHSYMVFNGGNATWANIMGEIAVKKEPYFGNWAVIIETKVSYTCSDVSNETHYHTICTVTELRKSHKFDIILSLCLQPKTIGSLDRLADLNLALSSHVTVNFDNNEPKHSNQSAYILNKSVGSNLRAKQAAVPLWVIIAAAIVGIFIMVIIAFVLYECGFLRRKNREKLKGLRSSVHRQSVRRSMIQDSIRNSNRISAAIAEKKLDDKEKLVNDKSEEFLSPPPSFADEAPKPNIPPKADKAPMADITAPKVETPATTSVKVPSVMVNIDAPATAPVADKMARMSDEKAHTNDELLNDKEALAMDQEMIKKQHIILGLQKNIGSRQYPVKPGKPKRHEEVTDEAKLI